MTIRIKRVFFIVCVLQRIIRSEKDRQEFVMAEALGISVDVGGSVKVFRQRKKDSNWSPFFM